MKKYKISEMMNGQKGSQVNLPVIPESLAFRRSYLAEMRRVLHEIAKAAREQIIPSYRAELITDARESDFEALRRVVKGLLLATNENVKRLVELEALKHTERFAAAARQSFKIDLQGVIAAEDLQKYIDAAALRNAGLVTGMTDDLVKRIQTVTTNSLIKGQTAGQLRKELKREFEFSDARARLIARDQTSKLNADLNRIRQQQAGVDSYTWRTSRDERVREDHRKVNGKVYKYGEQTGIKSGAEPGQDIQCRCFAQGVVTFGDEPAREVEVTEPKLPPGVEQSVKARSEADEYVLKEGLKDGNEHLVVLRSDGSLVSRTTSGRKGNVGPDDKILSAMKTEQGLISIHNHPSGRSLSSGDLITMTHKSNGFTEVWALGHNGSRYVARSTGKVVTASAYKKISNHITNALKVEFAVDFVTGSLSGAEVDRVFAHILNTFLSDKGVIDYKGELSEDDAAIYNRISKRLKL